MSLIEQISETDLTIRSLESTNSSRKRSIGISALNEIYKSSLKSVIESSISKSDVSSITPLYTINIADVKFNIVFDLIRNYEPCDFKYMDEIISKLDDDKKTDVIEIMDKLEYYFLTNVTNRYSALNNTYQKTYTELARVTKSRKYSYLYMFKGSRYKKSSMGFIAIKDIEQDI